MLKKILYISAMFIYCSCQHAGPMDEYNGCGLEGDARREDARTLNVLKNRYTFPDSTDIDHTVSLQAMLAPGNDENRFDDHKAAVITGYVYNVMVGGDESCNCHARNPKYRDTHIEIVLPADSTHEKRCVIAEVTPRMRAIMAQKGIDWSTDNLRRTLKGHIVQVTGWLLFDNEHIRQAENTAPHNHRDWRATCWEIHPITDIKVINVMPL